MYKRIAGVLLSASIWLAGCAQASFDPVKKSVRSYDSYRGLVMAGYQGWFAAEGDDAGRGFYHYKGRDGFRPGSATIDLWPDVSEYEKTYETAFKMPDGSPARVFSSNDPSTVDTHFRWMKEYGLDGVFMQRFVAEIRGESGKMHFDKVLSSAMDAANKYDRAICVMYDLSGMMPDEKKIVPKDMAELAKKYSLFEHSENPSYLYHNGKPLVAVWGVGFNDRRKYSVDDCEEIIDGLIAEGFSVLIGVPTYWREFGRDTENNDKLHEVIRKCDVVMPWFVGRYDSESYDKFAGLIPGDKKWCDDNGLDYAPLVFPGFSWRNMLKNSKPIPRDRGAFLQKQIDGAFNAGADMLYVAMFDEIDEGTAIFKCATTVPVTENGTEFVPIEKGLDSDHYLKIVGKAAKKMKKRK